VVVDDFNRDGRPDLAVANAGTDPGSTGGSISVLLGWVLYVDANNDSLPPNIQRRVQFDLVNVKGSWVLANAQLDTTTSNIEAGVLFPHVGSASVYRSLRGNPPYAVNTVSARQTERVEHGRKIG
jgi:hypothetical protein